MGILVYSLFQVEKRFQAVRWFSYCMMIRVPKWLRRCRSIKFYSLYYYLIIFAPYICFS
uniref:Pheromone 2 binding protein n=1 Tax=Euplotoides octocarinatus TaxID=2716877 RepID=Q9N6T6_EUPOC|nr:pheromone 2 binding protein [Euplotes octocarinatus]AAF37881.1 pheromone 2 binding protein [Euplotes octocarinatus]